MQTNNHQIVDYDLVLDQKFGKEGTPERIKAEEDALSFYSGQILRNARKEAKVTQTELAKRINSTKSYISKVENGVILPSVGAFYRIINALGMRVEVLKMVERSTQLHTKNNFDAFHILWSASYPYS